MIDKLAKEVAEKAFDEYVYNGKSIMQLVNETMEHDWIPCSERLPELTDSELYTMALVTIENGDVCLGAYHSDDKEWRTRMSVGEKYYSKKHKVVAWMPLPEPYKEGD